MRYLVNKNQSILFEATEHKICSLLYCKEYLEQLDIIEVDTETTGLDVHNCELLCFQLGNPDNQFVIPYTKENLDYFKDLLQNKNKLFLFANAKFDLKFFIKKGINIVNLFDVFLAECVLFTGYEFRVEDSEHYIGTSLEALCKKYLNIELNKTIRNKIHSEGLSDRVIKYAAEDVAYLTLIREQQMKLLESKELLNTIDLENKAVIAFAHLEYNGIKIDTAKWMEVAKEVKNLEKEQIKSLDNILISNHDKYKAFLPLYSQGSLFDKPDRLLKINWSSSLQKLKILQIENPKLESTGDRELQKIKKKNKIAKELIEYNKFSKLKTSFGEKFLNNVNSNTKRIHCDIWQVLQTGRISVSNPNLNQIPSKGNFGKLIRSCFIVEKGNVLVGGDYSGIELRIIAEFSNDPIWLDAFDNGKDLHSILCSMTFGIPVEDVKKPFPQKPDITYRDIQKTINFGLAYGMSEFKLADTMDISIKEAKNIIDKFFKAVPKVKKLLDELGNVAKSNGYIRTALPFKRMRRFPEWTTAKVNNDFTVLGEIERAGKNTPIQGTNGDIIKWALYTIQTKITTEKLPIKILLSVYDEIRTECPINISEWWKEEINRIMIESAKVVLKRVPVEVDCKISECWEK
jgi:DNA polymerase-1